MKCSSFFAILPVGLSLCLAQSLAGAVPEPSLPREAFAPLRLGEIKPEGWIKAQLRRDLEAGFLGHLDELLQDPRSKHFLLKPEHNDFVTRERNRECRYDAEGRTLPPQPYSWWDGEMIGDWHDGLIRAAFLVDEPKALQKAERYVQAMLKSQDRDGYIGIYPAGHRYHFAGADAELWTQRCALLGLLAYYEFTRKPEVLESVERSVRLTISQCTSNFNYFENPAQTDNGVAHGLMFVDVLEWLYRITAGEHYGDAALSLYRDYCASTKVRNQDAQLQRLLDRDSAFAGHGPDVMGFLRIPLLCYYLSGKTEFLDAWENSMQKTERHLGVGGSPLSGHGEEIMRQGQTPDMPYEFCSTFYLLHSLTWAVQKTGQAHYADLLESTLFNAAQGARFPDGKALTYYSADERYWVRQQPPEGRGNRRFIYTAAYYPSCCHDSGARIYPYAISSMWMRSYERADEGEGLVAAVYGPSRVSTVVNGVELEIVEQTGYPFDFEINLQIEPARQVQFPLRLKIPSWSKEPQIHGVGKGEIRREEGFVVVNRTWNPGDKLRLSLKPSVKPRKGANGTIALSYGPLVFSLPIEEKAEIVQQFPEAEALGLRGFYGYQYDPLDLRLAKRPLALEAGRMNFGFLVRERSTKLLDPWKNPPLEMRGVMLGRDGHKERVTLLPMGSTILRRTCFSASH